MKNYLKVMVVAAGITLATFSSFDVQATNGNQYQVVNEDVTTDLDTDQRPSEGCRRTGDCGTTPGGVKLNGSWTIDTVAR